MMAVLGAAACTVTLVNGIRARSWTETPARMIECSWVTGRTARQHLAVRYAYSVNGQQYVGTRVGFTDGTTKGNLALQYAAGRRVTCFVNPNDPAEVMLRREIGLLHWLFPGLFLAGAVGLGFGARRALAQQRIADAATLYSLETGQVTPAEGSDRQAA